MKEKQPQYVLYIYIFLISYYYLQLAGVGKALLDFNLPIPFNLSTAEGVTLACAHQQCLVQLAFSQSAPLVDISEILEEHPIE